MCNVLKISATTAQKNEKSFLSFNSLKRIGGENICAKNLSFSSLKNIEREQLLTSHNYNSVTAQTQLQLSTAHWSESGDGCP